MIEMKKFGDFATFKYGKMLNREKFNNKGKYPVYSGYRYVGYYNDYNTEANQLIVVARGVGGTGDVKLTKERCYLTNLSIRADIDKKVALPEFIYYYYLPKSLRYLDSGSAQSQITISDLEKVVIPIPTLAVQKSICQYMKILDKKIELNNAINENLEKQAEAIFKSWFVDFEPFGGAKPSSWVQALLGDIAKISSGTRSPIKSTEKTEKTNIPILGAASIMGFTNQSNHNDKILVTGRVGTHGVVQRFHTPCWTSDNTLVITSKFYEYVYQILKKIDYGSMNRGSTQPLITQTDMKKISIIIPDKTTLEKFETIVGKLMDKYETNILENEKLSKLRDTLLPKLMSGEIDVSNVNI